MQTHGSSGPKGGFYAACLEEGPFRVAGNCGAPQTPSIRRYHYLPKGGARGEEGNGGGPANAETRGAINSFVVGGLRAAPEPRGGVLVEGSNDIRCPGGGKEVERVPERFARRSD
jgi:hypothetical protein